MSSNIVYNLFTINPNQGHIRMQPRLLFIGKISEPAKLQTAKQSNQEYCNLTLECTWSYNVQGQVTEKKGQYQILFYKQKAVEISQLFVGQHVAVECLVTSQEKEGQNGTKFYNLSLYGQNYEVLTQSEFMKPSKSQDGFNNKREYPSPQDVGFNSDDIPF